MYANPPSRCLGDGGPPDPFGYSTPELQLSLHLPRPASNQDDTFGPRGAVPC